MREVRSTTDQSVEGLYGETVRHTSLKDKTVLGALRSRYPYEGFLQTCGILLAMLTFYGALLAAIGKDARLPGPVWAVPLIWICAQAAGFVAAKVGLPPTVGMVAMGLLLRNVPGEILKALPFTWSIKLRLAGLVLMLLQCGLAPQVQVPNQSRQISATALALLPLLAEAVALGLCLGLWLKLDVFMAVAGALILSAVCPALVGVITQQWQCSRLGTRKGVSVWLQSAARWNVSFAIAGFSLFLGLAVPHHNLGLQIAHGPLSIAIGLAAGTLLGLVCALTPVWSSPLRRAIALITMGELVAFCGVNWDFPAAGYLAILVMTGLSSLVWRRSSLSQLCDQIAPGASEKTVHQVHGIVELAWAGAIQPLIMGLAGASIHFPSLPLGTALKALALTAIGLSVRGCTAMAVLLGGGYSWTESIVMALVWLSGGSIQATLVAAPLELAYLYKQSAQHYIAQAEVITLVGVFSILIGASICWLSGAILGPAVLSKQQEDLPVTMQPSSPETTENNPFLSSLQQSGISMTGNGNRDSAMQVLRKTESVEAQGRHGNPFSDDGSAEGRHDKSPLLIASADSSYALDPPHRIASHNPFAGSRNGEYHSLSAVRRDTSGDSSSFVPNRSSLSVPALVLPVKGGALRADNEMTGDDRRRTTESLLWENEPMSTAAAVGSSSSSGKRTSRNSMDAVSCVWENEPMSAAATLSSVPRLTLQRVSEAAEGQLDGRSVEDDRADFAALGASRLAGGEKVRIALPISSARSGVLGLRPHRQAPLPPVLRSNSFPSHDQDEGYLEFEVTSGLTLKETPRSQRRRDVQRGSWSRQTSLTGQAVGVSEPAHAGTSGSPHVSFALPALSQGQQANADADIPLQSSTSAEVAAVIASIMPPQHVDLQTSAAALHPDAKQMQYAGHGDAAAQSAVVPDTTEQNAGQVPVDVMSRHASVITLYESAHSGVLSDSGDVVTAPDGVILS